MAASLSVAQLSNLTSNSAIGSWAEAVEQEVSTGQRQETTKDGIKTVTDYTENENGDKIKVITKFKVITKKVPKAIAERKKWRKFGNCENDSSGPQVATTYVSDEVRMQFTRNRAGEQQLEEADDPARKLREKGGSAMHCRHCKANDHWSVNCPYKDLYPADEDPEAPADPMNEMKLKENERKTQAGAYIAPNLRNPGSQMRGTTMFSERRDENTCRVTNLPEDSDEQDLRDLFGKMGKVTRVYLAKDKATGRSKGFAFVTYERRDDAEKAIESISGHRYDHLILKVEWAKQNTN
uniref:Eukaryotic translation initiation factor 3 subunit G n=1 Tax=Plectus sambesii TaxID=2011161 RepID=A0A914W957_9BILA